MTVNTTLYFFQVDQLLICNNICQQYKLEKWRDESYYKKGKFCRTCQIYIEYDGLTCPCCYQKLRLKPRSKAVSNDIEGENDLIKPEQHTKNNLKQTTVRLPEYQLNYIRENDLKLSSFVRRKIDERIKGTLGDVL